MKKISALVFAAVLLSVLAVQAQQVAVEEYTLANGFKLLMIPKKGDPNVAAGWVAKVGSVNERPGITGLSHLFEHMMFKGTRAIGTTDIAKELSLMERMDSVKAEIRKEEHAQLVRLRLGEIAELGDPKNRTARHNELLQQLAELETREKDLIVPNEFDKVYTNAGASGMNAGTSQDFTVYYINVPANKLELWFWMESDRLLNPVFREFYSERDVVAEERRMSVESTPTGKFEEEFDSLFWTASPYSWPVIGWPSDLDGITREEATAYFDLNYAPNNVVACLVGDFDPAKAKELADRYFGRLRRSPQPQPPPRTREIEQQAEKRMTAFAETNPQVEIRYHTVADGNTDEPALVVLGSLLNGRTGRLYKSMVLDQKVASSASAGQDGMKWEGLFYLEGVAKPGNSPEQVEKALYQNIETLQKEKVSDRELQKVKNQFAADNFRRLQDNFTLMLQLLISESNRGWQSLNEDPKKIAAVTAEDIQRVASRYFKPENRAVALYYTKKSTGEEEDPLLSRLSDEDKAEIRQFQGMLAKLTPDQIKAFSQNFEVQAKSFPPDKKDLAEAIRKMLQDKILKDGGK